MQLKDIARCLPEEIWALFEPILPARIWCGNGRPPKSNRDCFHALLYVLVAGIPWEMLPAGFPSHKTVQRRLAVWLALDVFHQAWRQLAERYQTLHGINWDQVLLDGSKKPAKKGANKPDLHRWTGPNAGLPCNSRATVGPCPWEQS